MSNDPVHQDTDGWYFWEETWADRSGPFKTETLARAALKRYCTEVLGSSPRTLNRFSEKPHVLGHFSFPSWD